MAGWNVAQPSLNIISFHGGEWEKIYNGDDNKLRNQYWPITTIDGITVRTIYVTQIPVHAKWIDLRKAFSVYGDIKKLYLKSKIQRPFAFVTYNDPCSAVKVLSRHSMIVLGKRVHVAVADSWHQPIENTDGTINWSKQENKKINIEEEEGDDDRTDESEAEVELNINIQDNRELEDSINVLNDDCLSHVFSFLSYSERVNIERVCKRWQALNYTMWRRIHSLDFTSPSMSCIPLNLTTLKCLLERCNTNLRTLNLCVKNHMLDARALVFVAKYCQNVEELYIYQLTINNRSLPHLGKYCTRLKKIIFKECLNFTDNDLIKLFYTSRALTSVTITRFRGFAGTSLKALTTPLEYLNLNYCINLYPDALLECLVEHSSTLKHLSLSACKCLRGSDMSRIINSVPNLTFLSLSQNFPLFDKQSLLPLGQLAHLQELNLKENGWVSDDVVAAIVEGCKELTVINLSGCRWNEGVVFTSEGLSKLGKLPNLTNLNISYLLQTNDVCLTKLIAKTTRLKFIKCIGCPGLSDIACTQVVSLCNELEEFDLSGNKRVTNETVKTALDSVKLCSNRKPLELIVGGTSVDITSDDERLIINQRDFSRFHIRHDFVDNLFFPPSDDEDDLEHLEYLCSELDDFSSDLEDTESDESLYGIFDFA